MRPLGNPDEKYVDVQDRRSGKHVPEGLTQDLRLHEEPGKLEKGGLSPGRGLSSAVWRAKAHSGFHT